MGVVAQKKAGQCDGSCCCVSVGPVRWVRSLVARRAFWKELDKF